jgi:hypothetical protein
MSMNRKGFWEIEWLDVRGKNPEARLHESRGNIRKMPNADLDPITVPAERSLHPSELVVSASSLELGPIWCFPSYQRRFACPS